MWDNIAIPSILYGAECLPIDNETINELESIQNTISKIIMGLPKSTANTVTQLELGLKTIKHKVIERKIRFITKIKENENGCKLTKECLEHLGEMYNIFLTNLDKMLEPISLSTLSLKSTDLQKVDAYFKEKMISSLRTMPSLKLMPIPTAFWKINNLLSEAQWSRTLVRFRTMNAGLGNRGNTYRDYAAYIENGRVVTCPICLQGKNDEIHLLLHCTSMQDKRSEIKIGSLTLQQTLEKIKIKNRTEEPQEICRLFLGQEKQIKLSEYCLRGLALMTLIDEFFEKWSEKKGYQIPRQY